MTLSSNRKKKKMKRLKKRKGECAGSGGGGGDKGVKEFHSENLLLNKSSQIASREL